MPPPDTAGPPLGLAAMATADAEPLAMMDARRSVAITMSPTADTSAGWSATPSIQASTSLRTMLRVRLKPTETERALPLAPAAIEIALAETLESTAFAPLACTRTSPSEVMPKGWSTWAETSALILFIATTGATAMVIRLFLESAEPDLALVVSRLTATAEFLITASMKPAPCALTSKVPAASMRVLWVQASVREGVCPPNSAPKKASTDADSRSCGA